MEPNKFEKEFRNKLNQREIDPSENSWDRLDAMLTAQEKKTKGKYGWIYIAASFVGLALVSTICFNGFELVEINKSTSVVISQKSDSHDLNKPELINKAVLPDQIQKSSLKINKALVVDNFKKQPKIIENKEEEVLIINQSKENPIIVNSSENKNNQSTTINKYISAEKLLAEVSNTKFERKATDEIIKNNSKGISVNPNNLLLNAETELNQSYRESALETLTKNFKVIKTVLVNRNYKE